MKKGLLTYFIDVFTWGKGTPYDMAFLKAMMLFNLFFLCMQSGIFPYFWVSLQMIVALYLIKYVRIKGVSKLSLYPLICYFCLFLWTLYIIFRNGFSSLQMISHLLFMPFNYVCLLMPFILLPFAKIENLQRYVNFIVKTVKVSLFLMIVLFPFMYKSWQGDMDSQGESIQLFEVLNTYINGGLAFCLILIELVEKRDKKYIHIASIVSLFLALFFARRGVALSYLVAYSFYFLVRLYSQNAGGKIVTFLKGSIICLIIGLFVVSYGGSLFSRLYERGTEDTRSVIELSFLEQIISSGEIVQGRGFAGTYSAWEGMDYAQEREGIETGYLHLILKGGIVYLVLMGLLFIPTFFCGLIGSRNKYVKILSLYNLWFILFFIVANNNMTFSMRFFMFVISTYIIYNKKYRKMSNWQIKEILIENGKTSGKIT